MAAEKGISRDISEIRKMLKKKAIIIGADRALKGIRLGKVKKVYLSANCSESLKKTIGHYSKLSRVEIVNLRHPSDELGILCKKPFSISVLSVPV
ncbi:ribosomal L7Ae/L30e/S12e/Gadd45 family protein [Candidatus Woesearchaeota archaeon]|nr:ribosomal L7Ae/L30e/S12e/Gadd45 family protein [Candidatus Woesearchaeota archaeon]